MGNNSLLLQYRIWGGFLAFGICAAFGLRLLYRGIRDDVYDTSGTPLAGRGWFIAGGIFCLLPLVAYFFFVWKQGYFDN
jgi:hypothetical protein